MKKNTVKMTFKVSVVLLLFASISLSGQVPEEIKAMVGTYQGSWAVFGLDSAGEIVIKMTWTDIMEASGPMVKNGRAYVNTIDTMNFGNGIPPQKVQGIEGYFLNSDGSLGDYFFEMNGKVTRMKMLEKNIWVYSIPADPMEMRQLGFSNIVFSHHILNKVVTWEKGVETHRISRVTTVSWKDKEGAEHWEQFISLKGVHKRQK